MESYRLRPFVFTFSPIAQSFSGPSTYEECVPLYSYFGELTMYAKRGASLPALSPLQSSQPSYFTVEGPKAQGAQQWSLGRGPRPTPASQAAWRLRTPCSGARPVAPAVQFDGADGAWPCPGSGQTARDVGPAETPRCRSHRPLGRPGPSRRPPRLPAPAERPLPGAEAGRPRSSGATAAWTPGAEGRHRRVSADASRRGRPIVPRAWAFHPALPGRFPPRADGATSRHGHGARGVAGRRGAESSAWARRQPSPPRCLLRPGGAGEARGRHAASATSRAGRHVPVPRKERMRTVVRSRFRLLHVLLATTVSRDFILGMQWKHDGVLPCGVRGPPAPIVWLPDGSSSAIFLTPNVVIRGQQRDLQGGFVCSKRAVAKRPLLNGRRAAFSGDRAGDPGNFFHIN